MNRTLTLAFRIYFVAMLPYNPLNAEVHILEAGPALPALHSFYTPLRVLVLIRSIPYTIYYINIIWNKEENQKEEVPRMR
jgi:hypothetical protein